MIEVHSVENRTLEIAALILPGHADNSLTIPLGYGRTIVGRVGHGDRRECLRAGHQHAAVLVTGAKVKQIDGNYPLAITQEHSALEGRGSDIIRESNFEKYKEVASAAPDSEDAPVLQEDRHGCPHPAERLPLLSSAPLGSLAVGHDHRPQYLRRLFRLYDRLPG